MVCSSRSRNCRGIELSSRDFKTVAISVTRGLKTVEVSNYRAGTWKLSSISSISSRDLKTVEHIEQGLDWKLSSISSRDLKTVEHIEQGLENCRGIELSSRDFKTVAISVTRAKLYCINTWFACTSPSPEAQSPAGDLASAYPPKPLLFTLLGVGAWYDLQSLWAKLHRIWAWFAPPSPAFEAHPPEGNFSIRVSSQTPTFWNGSPSHAACLRALRCITVAWRKVAGWLEGRRAHTESFRLISVKVSCNNFGQSYSVFRHGLHLRTLRLMHSPLQAT